MKKILSLLMAIAMLSVAFFGFSLPASAISYIVDIDEPYYETELAASDGDLTKSAYFTVPHSGYYIIQVFGLHEDDDVAAVDRMFLKYNETVLYSTRLSSPYNGYGRGRLLYCNLDMFNVYEIEVRFSGAAQARLSITYAEGLFTQSGTLTDYYNITTFAPSEIDFTFTQSNMYQAQVALIKFHDADDNFRSYDVEVSGCDFAYLYLLDPRSEEIYGVGYQQEIVLREVELETDVPYYLVLCLDYSNSDAELYWDEVNELVVTVSFTEIS